MWSGARGGDTGSALIFTLLGDPAGGGVPPPPITGKLLLLAKKGTVNKKNCLHNFIRQRGSLVPVALSSNRAKAMKRWLGLDLLHY